MSGHQQTLCPVLGQPAQELLEISMVEKGEPNDANITNPLWVRVAAMFVSIVLVAVVFILVGIFAGGATPSRTVPHIIFILADDLGWNDVSFHGSSQIPTPNIDALAASGIVLNNYYTHSLCSPSRGALMSGKYANRLGLYEDLKPTQPLGLPLNVPILPEYMQKLGYKTHMVGKWHLGYHKKDYLPIRRGFNSFYGFMNDYIDYYDYTTFFIDKPESPEEQRLFGVDLWENDEVVRDFRGEYATNVFTQKAVEVIEQHNTTKPLFLFVSHSAPHTGNSFFPLQIPTEYYARNRQIKDENRRNYAGMVSALDDSVGKIFESLDKKKMLSKTIIIFTSDNGGYVGASSNWPLRGQKNFAWEGGLKSPALVWSPLLGLEQPRTSYHLMHITDWLPTLYHLSGGDTDDLGDIDGLNMWPALKDPVKESPRTEVFLLTEPSRQAGSYRKGDMKLLFAGQNVDGSDWYASPGNEDLTPDGSLDSLVWQNESTVKDILVEKGLWLLSVNDTWRLEPTITCGVNFLPVSGKCDFSEGPCLYNITEDPCEFKNIAKRNPKIVESLMERFRQFNASSLVPPEIIMDPFGNPMCHDFAHVPWLEEEFQCVRTTM